MSSEFLISSRKYSAESGGCLESIGSFDSYLGASSAMRRLRRLEGASNRGSGSPMNEPFVKHRSLHLGNGAGVDYTRVGELLIFS